MTQACDVVLVKYTDRSHRRTTVADNSCKCASGRHRERELESTLIHSRTKPFRQQQPPQSTCKVGMLNVVTPTILSSHPHRDWLSLLLHNVMTKDSVLAGNRRPDICSITALLTTALCILSF